MDGKEHGTDRSGQKYYLNIEEKEYEWDRNTITVEELRTLAGIQSDQPMIEEDADGTERTLTAGQSIELQPGHRYGRAPKYRRG